jgi:hypothetical protein
LTKKKVETAIRLISKVLFGILSKKTFVTKPQTESNGD